MTDISAANFSSVEAHRSSENEVDYETRESIAATLLSGLLIVGFPAAFWIAVLEVTNHVFSIGMSVSTRLTIGGILLVLLGLIWGCIIASARQHRSARLKAELAAR